MTPDSREARVGFDREDGSCPCGGHSVERTNKATGQQFHGCSNFPTCRNGEGIDWRGSFLLSPDDIDRAYYDAFYDGDGKW